MKNEDGQVVQACKKEVRVFHRKQHFEQVFYKPRGVRIEWGGEQKSILLSTHLIFSLKN